MNGPLEYWTVDMVEERDRLRAQFAEEDRQVEQDRRDRKEIRVRVAAENDRRSAKWRRIVIRFIFIYLPLGAVITALLTYLFR